MGALNKHKERRTFTTFSLKFNGGGVRDYYDSLLSTLPLFGRLLVSPFWGRDGDFWWRAVHRKNERIEIVAESSNSSRMTVDFPPHGLRIYYCDYETISLEFFPPPSCRTRPPPAYFTSPPFVRQNLLIPLRRLPFRYFQLVVSSTRKSFQFLFWGF